MHPFLSLNSFSHHRYQITRVLTRGLHPGLKSPLYRLIQLSNRPSNKSSKHQITQAPNKIASNNTTANNIASNNPGIKLPTHQLTQGLNFKVCILTNFSSG